MQDTTFELMEVIKQATGISLTEEKIYLLESRLSDILSDYNLSDFGQLSKKFKEGYDLEFNEKVIERVTTHETRFFRDESIFGAILERIIPEILERKQQKDAKIKIWSAACSTGQEPYSVAISIHEKYPQLFKNISITATDIAKDTIEKAKSGIYSAFEIGRGLSEAHLAKYFDPVSKGLYVVNEEVRSVIEFKQHNLIYDPYPSNCDLILCRNVSYYFDQQERRSLFNKIEKALNQDSFLILGSAESISEYSKNFIIREFGLCRFYELNPSNFTLFIKGA
ncbi:CheR family methyltransferase [Leptospira licerasiae]|uniref:protein-glutamate O-methyltransferase n=1 Tax=Leptospira licerasiae str. MMD4847 TaxID=1049971 RepID=A0ABN0H7I9_9LEPT|nr:protein-glutamate O-methyltransferase CheR [Leptospira licerasiae]EID99655.1 methyltransferase CheR, SAM binding domain protein [Leptospira licerasiae serovar Varillal str. VAR 010]EJZ41548.1 chemotaxis protein methyltransferase CheR [Leptospira licerasiae str. MMD4847]